MEFDDITKFAALVGTSLSKVDRQMLGQSTSGPANKLDIRKFIAPVTPPGTGAPPPNIQPQVVGHTNFTPASNLMPLPSQYPQESVHPLSSEAITSELIKYMAEIADSLNKINKKLTSLQKYYNEKLKQPSSPE